MSDPLPPEGDGDNTIEHLLRDLVKRAKYMWEIEAGDKHIYIKFDADYGGRWSVLSYGPDVSTQGAELILVMNAHCDSYRKSRNLSVLRGSLTHQPDNDA